MALILAPSLAAKDINRVNVRTHCPRSFKNLTPKLADFSVSRATEKRRAKTAATTIWEKKRERASTSMQTNDARAILSVRAVSEAKRIWHCEMADEANGVRFDAFVVSAVVDCLAHCEQLRELRQLIATRL